MRMFVNNMNNVDSFSNKPNLKGNYNIIISGQSIAQGQYSLAQSNYSNDKIFNTGAKYLECKSSTHVWQTFRNEMMSPYQYVSDYSWGCGMEYSLAKHFTDLGHSLNIYKPAWGGQKFGTDSSPGKFHISSDGNTLGEISQDIISVMNTQKVNGVSFDYFLWMHGESDGRDALDSRNAYETNLRRFISKIRTIQPNIPFLIRQLPSETETWMGAVNIGGREAINMAIENIISDTPNCYLVVMPTPFSQGDLIHPSNPIGNDQMALAFWEELKVKL